MKLISNWQQAYKSLAVILPTLGNLAILLLLLIEKSQEMGLIPVSWLPVVSAVITPVLAFLGRVIPQVSLYLGDKK